MALLDLIECVWFLVGLFKVDWLSDWSTICFSTEREIKIVNLNMFWKLKSRLWRHCCLILKISTNQLDIGAMYHTTMCEWSSVKCFGSWKPVSDTEAAPLFGLDWYPGSLAAKIFLSLICLFTPNSDAAANCSKSLFLLCLLELKRTLIESFCFVNWVQVWKCTLKSFFRLDVE